MTKMDKKTNKVYCEKCDSVFESKEKFYKHLDSVHSPEVSCESCPIDTVISKFVGLFRKNKTYDLE